MGEPEISKLILREASMEKFSRTTWAKASRLLCSANEFPPGFRIALYRNGRPMSASRPVLTGAYGRYPRQFSVRVFIEEAIHNSLRQTSGKKFNLDDFDRMELKDHKGRTIDLQAQVQEVREMRGQKGTYSDYCYEIQDFVNGIAEDLADQLEGYEIDNPAFTYDDGPVSILRALFQTAVDRFETEDVAYAASLYLGEQAVRRHNRPHMSKKRRASILRRSS